MYRICKRHGNSRRLDECRLLYFHGWTDLDDRLCWQCLFDGLDGGFVLLALCLAPYLRKLGHYTVPEFIGDRYESDWARLIAIVCAIFISFTYVHRAERGWGGFQSLLKCRYIYRVYIGMGIVFIYATLGGMKGITWTQVAQYWVLITAFLVPTIAISIQLTGIALPSWHGSSFIRSDRHWANGFFSCTRSHFDGFWLACLHRVLSRQNGVNSMSLPLP